MRGSIRVIGNIECDSLTVGDVPITSVTVTPASVGAALAANSSALDFNDVNFTGVGTINSITLANLPSMAATATSGNLIQSSGDRALADAAVAVANLATMAANGVAGNLVQTAGASKALSDAGLAVATIPTMAAVGGAGNLLQTAAADRAVSDAGVAVANLATMAAAGGAGNLVQTAGASKALSDAAIAVADVAAILANAIVDADFSGAATGRLIRTGAGAYAVIKDNHAAVTAPGVGDDILDGYAVGSLWTDTVGEAVYYCISPAEGAAVWVELGAAA